MTKAILSKIHNFMMHRNLMYKNLKKTISNKKSVFKFLRKVRNLFYSDSY